MSAPPRFTYDATRHQYRAQNGRWVSSQQVHGYVQDYSANLGRSMRELAEQLRAGTLDLRSWQLAMRDAVKAGHLATGMAAKGGRAQMTQADYGRVGAAIKENYKYLSRLADGIADGSIPLDGRVLARSEQYGKAARETYANFERREYQRRGLTEERNVRGKLDSCDGCLEATAKSWSPIGSLPLPGTRTCLHSCGCRLEFR